MSSFPKSQALFWSVASQLRTRLEAGQWAWGAKIPTETELARTYSVGINTIRRAVEVLADEGLVERRQGSGTYVTVHRNVSEARFVGVIVPSTTYYFPRIISGIERVVTAAGVRMLLSASDYDVGREITRMHEMLDAGISGLLIAPTLHLADPTDLLREIRSLSIPSVLIERQPADADPDDCLSYVSTDSASGVFAAIRHFAEHGRTRIGFLGRQATATAQGVQEGFERAMRAFGLELIRDAMLTRPEWTGQDMREYARICLEERLDAVFCLGDREATALLSRLRGTGIRVPGDVSVIAYDDELADIAEVPLTAVSPPKGEVGSLAAQLLLRTMATPGAAPAAVRMTLTPHLVIRESTDSPTHPEVENPTSSDPSALQMA